MLTFVSSLRKWRKHSGRISRCSEAGPSSSNGPRIPPSNSPSQPAKESLSALPSCWRAPAPHARAGTWFHFNSALTLVSKNATDLAQRCGQLRLLPSLACGNRLPCQSSWKQKNFASTRPRVLHAKCRSITGSLSKVRFVNLSSSS